MVWGYVDVWILVCVGVGVWRSEEVALMHLQVICLSPYMDIETCTCTT